MPQGVYVEVAPHLDYSRVTPIAWPIDNARPKAALYGIPSSPWQKG